MCKYIFNTDKHILYTDKRDKIYFLFLFNLFIFLNRDKPIKFSYTDKPLLT